MRYLTGSKLFFSSMPGFVPKDEDYMELRDSIEPHKPTVLHENGKDIFLVPRLSKEDLIARAKRSYRPNIICMFLVPGFCAEIGFTPADLESVRELRKRVDKQHEYLTMIYDSYVANGSFTLTESQRQQAYEEYKSKRPHIYKNNV